jgi:hypothetical protein
MIHHIGQKLLAPIFIAQIFRLKRILSGRIRLGNRAQPAAGANYPNK